MKKYLYIIIGTMMIGNVFAQNKNMTDTIFSIREVEVVGTNLKKNEVGKLNVPLQYLPLSVTTVSANTLDMEYAGCCKVLA